MSPKYRKARKEWLEDQAEDFQGKWADKDLALREDGLPLAARDAILRKEFDLTDEILQPYLDRAAEQMKRKKKKKKASEPQTGSGQGQPVDPTDAEAPVAPLEPGASAAQEVSNVIWASENISNDEVVRKDAPTSTAWALLCWARKNPDNFFGQLYRNVVLPSRKEVEEARDSIEDSDRLKRTLEKVKVALLKPD